MVGRSLGAAEGADGAGEGLTVGPIVGFSAAPTVRLQARNKERDKY